MPQCKCTSHVMSDGTEEYCFAHCNRCSSRCQQAGWLNASCHLHWQTTAWVAEAKNSTFKWEYNCGIGEQLKPFVFIIPEKLLHLNIMCKMITNCYSSRMKFSKLRMTWEWNCTKTCSIAFIMYVKCVKLAGMLLTDEMGFVYKKLNLCGLDVCSLFMY